MSTDLPHDHDDLPRPRLSRRGVLALGATAGVGLALGIPGAAHAAVSTQSEIWNQPTYYENLNTGTVTRTNFQYENVFYGQLESWMQFYYLNTPSGWVTPFELYLNGTYVNKPGMHSQSRAMDISHIWFRYQGGAYREALTARYDLWYVLTGANLANALRQYWANAASFNRFFGVVLTYLYNAEHRNHIHVDNSEGNGFNASTSQVQMVQASLNYIWGIGTSITSSWNADTDNKSRSVLNGRLGISGGLTSSTANWHSYCLATMRYGFGTQSY